MAEIDLLVQQLRAKGHTVSHVELMPENAGGYIFLVDGAQLNLEDARNLLEQDTAE